MDENATQFIRLLKEVKELQEYEDELNKLKMFSFFKFAKGINTLPALLPSSFCWSLSKKGHNFWSRLNRCINQFDMSRHKTDIPTYKLLKKFKERYETIQRIK